MAEALSIPMGISLSRPDEAGAGVEVRRVTVEENVNRVRECMPGGVNFEPAEFLGGVSELVRFKTERHPEISGLLKESRKNIESADRETKRLIGNAFTAIVVDANKNYDQNKLVFMARAADLLGLKKSVPDLKRLISYLELNFGQLSGMGKARRSLLKYGGALALGGILTKATELAAFKSTPVKAVSYSDSALGSSKPAGEKASAKISLQATEVPTETVSPIAEKTATSTVVPRATVDRDSNLPPTKTPEPTATAEPEPADNRLKKVEQIETEIGDKNLAEYLLEDLVLKLKGRGITLWNELPSYRERVRQEAVSSDNITFAFLGIDETRERLSEFNGNGWGRADVIMIMSFDPHTFKTTMISIPRDTFSPEVGEGGTGWDKINCATQASYIRESEPLKYSAIDDSFPLMQRILETATGLRIDGLVETNIDFMQGYVDFIDSKKKWHPGKDGIFDKLVPDGVPIRIKQSIVDNEYPVGFDTKKLVFEKTPEGQEPPRLNGRQLTEYSRSRHSDSDFGRSERQREAAMGLALAIIPQVIDDFSRGETKTLDKLIEAFEEHVEVGNLHYFNLDIIEVLTTIKSAIEDLKDDPNGSKILELLTLNSLKNLPGAAFNKDRFVSFGLSRENGTLTGYNGTTLALVGSNPYAAKSAEGNYMQTWKPLRNKVAEIIGV